MKLKKLLGLIIFIQLVIAGSFAQNFRSVTNLETSTNVDRFIHLDNSNFDQSFFWRKRYNTSGQQKDSYYFNSLYLRDSVGGIRFLGYEFNLMHEPFEDNIRLNIFRKWNIIRIGGALSLEYSPYYPIDDAFDYFNANLYIKYYHIKKASRGDKTTQYTQGSWGFLLEGEFKGRVLADFYFKTFPFTIIHLRYKKYLHNIRRYGIIFEFELNENGYKRTNTQSSRDIYNGITFLLGSEYNSTLEYFTLNFGFKMDFRNH